MKALKSLTSVSILLILVVASLPGGFDAGDPVALGPPEPPAREKPDAEVGLPAPMAGRTTVADAPHIASEQEPAVPQVSLHPVPSQRGGCGQPDGLRIRLESEDTGLPGAVLPVAVVVESIINAEAAIAIAVELSPGIELAGRLVTRIGIGTREPLPVDAPFAGKPSRFLFRDAIAPASELRYELDVVLTGAEGTLDEIVARVVRLIDGEPYDRSHASAHKYFQNDREHVGARSPHVLAATAPGQAELEAELGTAPQLVPELLDDDPFAPRPLAAGRREALIGSTRPRDRNEAPPGAQLD